MVHGPVDPGARSPIRGGNIGKEGRASACQFRLFRVCAPAKRNALERTRRPALGILEQTVIRRDPRSRLNDGPSKAGCSNLRWQLTSFQTQSRADRETKEFMPGARGHAVHGIVGSISGAAAQIYR